jgi:dihydroorotate dehydrogenase (fumarate)
MADLTTTYLGLNLINPLVVSASPLSKKVESVKALEAEGAAAVVLYSLFEEQILYESKSLDYFLDYGTESYAEALTYFPDLEYYNVGGEGYLRHIEKLKKEVQIPIIASLNGSTPGGWVKYARRMEAAGADALELNLYNVPTDFARSALDLEDHQISLVNEVRAELHIPLAVKISPFYTSLPNFARRLVQAGAKGLVIFNRFYQPDLDVETLEVVPDLKLSTSAELRLPLRWTAILYGRLDTDLALTTGVHTTIDLVKSIMAGASAVMLTSALLQNGPGHLGVLLEGLRSWLEEYEYESVTQMRGSMSQQSVAEPAAFERANYMRILTSFDRRLP